MSTFYLVLYIFIAVILLLCVVSFGMYLLHICGGVFESNDKSGKGFLLHTTSYACEEQQPLNQPQLSHITEEHEPQIELVSVRQHVQQRNNLTQQHQQQQQQQQQQHQHQQQQQMVAVTPISYQPTQPVYKPQLNSQAVETSITPIPLARPLSDYASKPAIPVKPMIHSLPSSKRNSIVKPTDAPPLPPQPKPRPLSVGGNISNRNSLVTKPKAPPPPPPAATVENVPPPPTYREAIYDAPQTDGGNYLSDDE